MAAFDYQRNMREDSFQFRIARVDESCPYDNIERLKEQNSKHAKHIYKAANYLLIIVEVYQQAGYQIL